MFPLTLANKCSMNIKDYKDAKTVIQTSASNASKYAWVFLVMKGDKYIPGAITGAYSLRNVKTKYSLVCMVTSDVSTKGREQLSSVFDEIIEVPYIEALCKPLKTEKQNKIYANWLNFAFTKWNMLSLTKYTKTMFVDADKIVLTNIDYLFDLKAPAGTFSSPWAEGYSKDTHGRKGMVNIYKNIKHGQTVESKLVKQGLESKGSFVAIGTMILLEPNVQEYNRYIKLMASQNDFGFSTCNSMTDEQSLAWFYTLSQTNWTMISQEYNWIPWHKKWLISDMMPRVFHFFGTKPWELPRDKWTDLEAWWQLVRLMLADASGKYAHLSVIYPRDQLSLEIKPTCCYCKLFDDPEYLNHAIFDESTGKIQCKYLI